MSSEDFYTNSQLSESNFSDDYLIPSNLSHYSTAENDCDINVSNTSNITNCDFDTENSYDSNSDSNSDSDSNSGDVIIYFTPALNQASSFNILFGITSILMSFAFITSFTGGYYLGMNNATISNFLF